MSQRSLALKVSKSPSLLASKMDGVIAMMNTEPGTYYGMDEVGAHTWSFLQASRRGESVGHFLKVLMDSTAVLVQSLVRFTQNGLETLAIKKP